MIDRPTSEYTENMMRIAANDAFTQRSSVLVNNHKPKGMPNAAKKTSQPALLTWIFCQSCATITPATTIDANTETGTAISMGRYSANRGTATKDSPNPKVDRTNVARKRINTLYIVMKSIAKKLSNSFIRF